jgi:hypothetical protein
MKPGHSTLLQGLSVADLKLAGQGGAEQSLQQLGQGSLP